MSVKKLLLTVFLSAFIITCFAQDDKGKSAKALMTEKEDLYLSKRAF